MAMTTLPLKQPLKCDEAPVHIDEIEYDQYIPMYLGRRSIFGFQLPTWVKVIRKMKI